MFKRMLKTVLNVILFLCLVILSYLTIIRGLFLETANAKTIDMSTIGSVKNYSKEDIHGMLDDILKENDIPTNVIDEVLEDENNVKIIDDYVNDVVDATINGENIPDIPTKKIEEVMEKGITAYNKKYNANISFDKVKKLVEQFAEKADTLLKLANQSSSVFSSLRLLLSNKIYYGVLIATLILILLIAVIFKKEAIFSLGGISIFNGIVLLITYLGLSIRNIEEMLELLPINLVKLKQPFLATGIIFIITGIVLFILYRIILVNQKRKLEKANHNISCN